MKKKRLEDVKQYFVNPESAKDSADLAELVSVAIMALSEFYQAQGREGNLSPQTLRWLDEALSGKDRLKKVFAELLKKEMKTRRFDSNFMGQIHPQGNKIGIISHLVASFMNNNTIVKEVSPMESEMEREALAEMAQWFGFDPEKASGNIVSGGSTANLAALWVAREKAMLEVKPGEKVNLYVFICEMKHYSLTKACNLLGRDVKLVSVPMDGFKTSPMGMEAAIQKVLAEDPKAKIMAVVGLAGETETGDVDDLKSLAKISRRYNAFFHVDAAYGGPFILSKAGGLFKGIELADSVTVDPHKLVYVPYAAGAILFRDQADHMLITKDMKEKARYLLKNHEMSDGQEPRGLMETRNFGMSRVEGSMGAGGTIATWATLRLLGREGLRVLLDHTLELTEYAYQRVQKSKILRPVHNPELNTLLVGLKPELGVDSETYENILATAQVRADRQGYYVSLNEQVDNGKAALRLVLMHPHTTTDHVETVIAVLEKEISKLLPRRTIK